MVPTLRLYNRRLPTLVLTPPWRSPSKSISNILCCGWQNVSVITVTLLITSWYVRTMSKLSSEKERSKSLDFTIAESSCWLVMTCSFSTPFKNTDQRPLGYSVLHSYFCKNMHPTFKMFAPKTNLSCHLVWKNVMKGGEASFTKRVFDAFQSPLIQISDFFALSVWSIMISRFVGRATSKTCRLKTSQTHKTQLNCVALRDLSTRHIIIGTERHFSLVRLYFLFGGSVGLVRTEFFEHQGSLSFIKVVTLVSRRYLVCWLSKQKFQYIIDTASMRPG